MTPTEQVAAEVWSLQGLYPEETMWGYTQDQFAKYMFNFTPHRKVSIDCCMIDCGDGSTAVLLFKNQADAEARRDYEEKSQGFSVEDAVGVISVEMDADDNVVGGTDMIRYDDEKEEEVY